MSKKVTKAKLLKEIKERVGEGKSQTSIAVELNAAGYVCPISRDGVWMQKHVSLFSTRNGFRQRAGKKKAHRNRVTQPKATPVAKKVNPLESPEFLKMTAEALAKELAKNIVVAKF